MCLLIACVCSLAGGLRNDGVGGDSRLGKRLRRGVRQEQYKRQRGIQGVINPGENQV